LASSSNFKFNFFFTNPVINPNEKDYLNYYLEEQAASLFSKNLGGQNTIFFSDYLIQNDNSILPFTDENEQKGVILDGNIYSRNIALSPNDPYAQILLYKSSSSLVYTR
jgi:hypothetical protein